MFGYGTAGRTSIMLRLRGCCSVLVGDSGCACVIIRAGDLRRPRNEVKIVEYPRVIADALAEAILSRI
ncbi:hypothetical protein CEXT_613321 [Caerostris extrusa]|uniref:Uncharacterized protein n=1 Tax=Caerostris extrusa TaxID=172846 RepID=A0AAV4P3C2_CAEEX|nr:hypothetical protein CEXT_613321 [Caerostris extrusa]